MATSRTTRSRLGKGLSSLMAGTVQVTETDQQQEKPDADPETLGPSIGTAVDSDEQAIIDLSINAVTTNPFQPRKQIDPEALSRLAQSIRQDGVMQPVIVRPLVGSATGDARHYELVVGERRWRAAKEAGLDALPAIVRDMDDRQVAQWALIENLQREDLNSIERSEAFRSLIDHFGMSHDQVAQQVGVDRSTISNLLRLLGLEPDVQQMVRDGLLSAGQAKALAALARHNDQVAVARRAIQHGLSVRQVEAAVRKLTVAGLADSAQNEAKEGTNRGNRSHLRDLEQQINSQLETRVTIRPGRKKGSGKMTIHFDSLDVFDGILARLGVNLE